jgi:hypothetical protein
VARNTKSSASVGSRTLDYKAILGIAGTIIAALVVVIWGYLSSDFDKQSSTNAKQWERLREISEAHVKLEADTFYLKQHMEESKEGRKDVEERLRALERRGERIR